MKESDFLLIGSKQEQRFDYPAVKKLYDSNKMLQSDFEYLGLSDVYVVQGFYRMNRENFLAFSKGASINTDDGAELEFSAPKNLRRSTTELNRRIMTPFLLDSPPWLKAGSLPVSQAMHHYYIAQAYLASVARNRAMKEVDEAIRLEPKNPKFRLLKMRILLEQDKSAEGAKEAFAALESGAEYIPDVLAMSDEFYLPEAQAIYRKIIEMGHKEVLPYLGLGNIALHSGNLPEAEKWFVQARALQPEHPAVLLAWGRLTAAKAQRSTDDGETKKQLQEARTLLEKAQAKGEESATIHTELGAIYYKLAIWEKAAESYTEALRMRRRRNDLRFSLGQAYAQLGRTAEAELKYREILSLSPDDADALKALQELGKKY
jgi:tetratricopeptide (TPR) repeat protein